MSATPHPKAPWLRFLFLALSLVVFPGTREASAQFTDVADSVLADTEAGFGVAWSDYDNDGDDDLFLANTTGPNKLFANYGVSGFADITTVPLDGALGDFGVTCPDVDGDGYPDLYITNGIAINRLLSNTGGSFSVVPAGDAADAGNSQSSAWADYDSDGDLDVFVTFWEEQDKLFRNDNGTFIDVTPPVMADTSVFPRGTGCAWGDFDNDRDPDLYVGRFFGSHLYRNEGGGVFADVTDVTTNKVGVTGVAWGDYDFDGDLDLYLSRNLVSNTLLRNDSTVGTVSFTFIFSSAIVNSKPGQGVVFLDYDNDMDQDIFVANAGVDNVSGSPNALIRNDRSDFFTDVSAGPIAISTNSRGVAVADYNDDGFLDMYVANWKEPNQLLENDASNGNNWLKVKLVGNTANTFGVGARIRLKELGLVQIREISAGSSLYSMNSLTAHFGLAGQTNVDSLVVFWPSGVVSDSVNLGVNQTVIIYESGQAIGIGDPGPPTIAHLYANSPNPFRSHTTIRYDLDEPSGVIIRVLDPQGRLVSTIENTSFKVAGIYEVTWDGRSDDGRRVAPGIYFYTLESRGARESRRMILLR